MGEYSKEYHRKNKHIIAAKKRVYRRKKIGQPPVHEPLLDNVVLKKRDDLSRLNSRIRRNIIQRDHIFFKRMIPNVSSAYIEQTLGGDPNKIREWLERQFQTGMSWDNYGRNRFSVGPKWEIDHIIPISMATNVEELCAICHYTNLQPMWANENSKKGGVRPKNYKQRKRF